MEPPQFVVVLNNELFQCFGLKPLRSKPKHIPIYQPWCSAPPTSCGSSETTWLSHLPRPWCVSACICADKASGIRSRVNATSWCRCFQRREVCGLNGCSGALSRSEALVFKVTWLHTPPRSLPCLAREQCRCFLTATYHFLRVGVTLLMGARHHSNEVLGQSALFIVMPLFHLH